MAKSHLSSLPLQVALYFNGWYLLIFYVAELVIISYKGRLYSPDLRQSLVYFFIVAMATDLFSRCGFSLPEQEHRCRDHLIVLPGWFRHFENILRYIHTMSHPLFYMTGGYILP